jgi:AraC family transcriptional regulator
MNVYVSIINDIIDYIECNIHENLQLADLSTRVGISDFHFNRIFKTVSGITLKQYVLGRKLDIAIEQLGSTNKSIINIALDLGFEYPEVFSRDFKNKFGVSPSNYRQQKMQLKGVKKAVIVERDIINYRGSLSLKGSSILIEDMKLKGIAVKADTNSNMFKQNLKNKTEAFMLDSGRSNMFKKDRFYTVVSCGGNENGEYNVFCGRQPENEEGPIGFDEFFILSGWYVDFIYL